MIFSSVVSKHLTTPVLLADYLAKRFTYKDRDEWVRLIIDGRMKIDGKTASINDMVNGGETVEYDAGEFNEPPADLKFEEIYEDDWLIAVNKPGNLLVHRAGKSVKNNLIYQLRFVRNPPLASASCIHRLDRFTSGVVLIAKTPKFKNEISELFRARQVEKKYIAYVHGIPQECVIDKPIGKDPDFSKCPKFRVDLNGKEAVTRIDRCTPLGNSFSRLEITPLTGRTHQIRVHCAYIGHPIIGDTLYNSLCRNTKGKLPLPSRHALHCLRMVFFHPRLQKLCVVEAPMPEDLIELEDFLSGKKKGPPAPFVFL